MSKYLKHFYVEAENKNKFLLTSNYSRSGKTHPPIQNLDVKVHCKINNEAEYCLSTCPDSTVVEESEGILILTEQQFIEELEKWFNYKKNIILDKAYNLYKKRFSEVFDDKYSIEEKLLFLEKYKESVSILNEVNEENYKKISPILYLEHLKTDLDIKETAKKIVEKFEKFTQIQTTIVADRKKYVDKIKLITFDGTTLDNALNSIRNI